MNDVIKFVGLIYNQDISQKTKDKNKEDIKLLDEIISKK